jgi:hypothetical protein
LVRDSCYSASALAAQARGNLAEASYKIGRVQSPLMLAGSADRDEHHLRVDQLPERNNCSAFYHQQLRARLGIDQPAAEVVADSRRRGERSAKQKTVMSTSF